MRNVIEFQFQEFKHVTAQNGFNDELSLTFNELQNRASGLGESTVQRLIKYFPQTVTRRNK